MRYLAFGILVFFGAETASAQSKIIDSLLIVAAQHTNDTNEIKVLDKLSGEFLRKDINKAFFYTHQQIALSKALATSFGLPSAYSGLIGMHQQTGRVDSALYYLNLLELLAKKIPPDKKAPINYANAAGLFYKNQGKIKEALPYLLDAFRLIGDKGDKTARAGQMLNIGNAYYNLGELKSAADYHIKALKLFEEVKNKRGQSFCLNSLGNDYADTKQYATAEKYFFQSEKLKEELGDKRGVLTSWMSLGVVYQQTNKPELSILYFNKALMRARELNLSLEESRVLFNMGSLFKQTKKNEEAITKFSQALVMARQSGDSALVSRIKTYLIALQDDRQKEAKEEKILIENVRISLETGALDNTAEGQLMLAEWYASRNEFEKAYKYLTLGQILNDSIKGKEVAVQLKKLEEGYNTEKKEKEIALLKKDQELQKLALDRQRANTAIIIVVLIAVVIIGFLLINRYRVMGRNKRLIELQSMRNSISRDLHDDIGSTLSSINIISKLALTENTHLHLQRIGDHSAKMMESMSDIVWSINPHNDSREQVVSKMKEFAAEILDPLDVSYSFSGEENLLSVTLDAALRKNLFLIFKEVINNAAKYSGANSIRIDFSTKANTLHLVITDNGKGFDVSRESSGNGLRNMKERAKDIRGSLDVKSSAETGTGVRLTLPIT